MISAIAATDFCCFPELDMRLSKQGLVYIKGDHRDSAAASSNGSGKSTIFKAITWCLYGETVDEMKGDDVIRLGAKQASVTVTLADGDTSWYVTRTRRKGKPGITIERETADEPGKRHPVKGDKATLNAKIIELIGLDFRAFKNTVLYGQNDNFKFADPRTGDTARKDMLHRILRTETLQACHKVAKDRYKDQRKEMDDVAAELEAIDREVEAVDLPKIKVRKARWAEGQRERIEALKQKAKGHKQRATDVLRDVPDVDALESRLAEMRTAYAAARATAKGGAKAREALNKHREAITKEQERWSKMFATADELRKQLERLDGDKCPLCTAPLTEGAPAAHRDSLDREATLAEQAQERARAYIKKLKGELPELNGAVQKAADAAAEADRIRDDADVIKDEMEEAKGVKDEAERYIQKARDAVEEAKRIKAEENPHEEALLDAKAKVKALMDKGATYEARRDELSEAMSYTQFWVRGYSPQGLPSFVLDAVMPFLTDQANEYLEVLADGDITMNLSTQRELKSQKDAVRDEISIEWEIEGNDGVAKSGGQRTRMNLAVDLALMDLAASREGIHLDLLMIDEALDGLDKEGTARVLQLLQKLRRRRGSIFVISHSDDMSELFEHGLVVVREGGESRVEEVR